MNTFFRSFAVIDAGSGTVIGLLADLLAIGIMLVLIFWLAAKTFHTRKSRQWVRRDANTARIRMEKAYERFADAEDLLLQRVLDVYGSLSVSNRLYLNEALIRIANDNSRLNGLLEALLAEQGKRRLFSSRPRHLRNFTKAYRELKDSINELRQYVEDVHRVLDGDYDDLSVLEDIEALKNSRAPQPWPPQFEPY